MQQLYRYSHYTKTQKLIKKYCCDFYNSIAAYKKSSNYKHEENQQGTDQRSAGKAELCKSSSQASIQATVLTLSICWSCWALMAAFTWSLSRFLYKEKEHHSETGDNYQLTNDAIVTKMFKSTSKEEDFLTITSDLKTVITELGNAPATCWYLYNYKVHNNVQSIFITS